MNSLLKPIAGLLTSAAILLMGNGLQVVLLPVRADIEGFSGIAIGLMGSAYFAGLMAGCIACPRAIARVGHIRAFAAFTAIATVAPLVHAIWVEPAVWMVLRFLTGVCLAGITMVIESWLNGAASNENRGRVLSSYTILNLTVVVLGQQMLGLSVPGDFALFSLVAVFISLAAVPVALTRAAEPPPPAVARLRIQWLIDVSPVSALGCFVTGLAGGVFWGLAPIFARSTGLSVSGVALFMSAVVLGGAIAQWPVGRWSDRIDRRLVIAIVSLGASAAGTLLVVFAHLPGLALYGFAALYGMTALTIYSLCLAHANDRVAKNESIGVSSGLMLVYAAGAIIGPFGASLLTALTAGNFLFAFTASAHAVLGLAALYRLYRRKAPGLRAGFVALARTSPAVFALDPRAHGDEGDGALSGEDKS